MSDPSSSTSTRRYTVQRGDSLWRIAEQQCGNPLLWKTIARLNGIGEPYRILVGQILVIPERSKAGSSGTRTSNSSRQASYPPFVFDGRSGGVCPIDPSRSVVNGKQPRPTGPVPYNDADAPSNGNGASGGAKNTAEQMAAPAFKHSIDHPIMTAMVGPSVVTFGASGDITIVPHATADVTITSQGVVEYTEKQQSWAAGEVVNLLSEVKLAWDPAKNQVKFSAGITFSAGIYSGKFEILSPNSVKYTCEPRDIEQVVEKDGVKFTVKGKISLWCQITAIDPKLVEVVIAERLAKAANQWRVVIKPEDLIAVSVLAAVGAALVVGGKAVLTFLEGMAYAGATALLPIIVITPEMRQQILQEENYHNQVL